MPPTDAEVLELRESVRAALRGIPSMLNLALMGTSPSPDQARAVAHTVRDLYASAEKSMGKAAADELVLPTVERVRARIVEVFGSSEWDEPQTAAAAVAKMRSLDHARVNDVARAVYQLADEARHVTDDDLHDLEARGLADVAGEIRRLRQMVQDRDLLLLRAVAALKVINDQMRERGFASQAVQLTEVVIRAIEAQVEKKEITEPK